MSGYWQDLIAWLTKLLNQENPIWLAIGFIGQAMFFSRFVIQWIVSERARKSIIPMSFWTLSIAGSVILCTYAVYKNEPVFMLGYCANSVVYVRNIMLIKKEQALKVASGGNPVKN